MKKIFAILSVLGTFMFSFVVRAEDNPLLSPDWWTTAIPEAIENAIRNGADVNEKNENGGTPLMVAAGLNNNTKIIETLIRNGADVKAKDDGGRTPLMFAASYNENPEIIETLIRNGADVKGRDNEGKTAFDYAKENPSIYHSDAYKLLESKMNR